MASNIYFLKKTCSFKPGFLSLYAFMTHYNMSKFLKAPLILNIPYSQNQQQTKELFLWSLTSSFFWLISTFWLKVRFFVNNMKISFYGHSSVNINISTKWDYFQNIVFSENIKISTKIMFFAKIAENINILRYIRFFAQIFQNINISRKISIFGDNFEEINFCPCIRKYQHVSKGTFLIFFLPIPTFEAK